MLSLGLLPDNGDRFVGRKIVAVIFQNKKIQCRNQPVGSIAGSDINLMSFQCRTSNPRSMIRGGAAKCKP